MFQAVRFDIYIQVCIHSVQTISLKGNHSKLTNPPAPKEAPSVAQADGKEKDINKWKQIT